MRISFLENGRPCNAEGGVLNCLMTIQGSAEYGRDVKVCNIYANNSELKELAAIDVLDEFEQSIIHNVGESPKMSLPLTINELQYGGGGRFGGVKEEEPLDLPDVFNFVGAAGTANEGTDDADPNAALDLPGMDWGSCGGANPPNHVANEGKRQRTTPGTRTGGEEPLDLPSMF